MLSFPSMARALAYRLTRFRVRRDLDRPSACHLFGLDLVISPGVLHPRHFASSRLLGAHTSRLDLSGRRVADIGTGSGILGLIAARAGAMVTAVDINRQAVSCALENVRRNRLETCMNVHESDVLDNVPSGERFDLILTNPPFYAREPQSLDDRAFAAGLSNDFFAKFAEQVPHHLKEGGRVLIVSSSDADFAPVSRALQDRGLIGAIKTVDRGLFETLTIREFEFPDVRQRM